MRISTLLVLLLTMGLVHAQDRPIVIRNVAVETLAVAGRLEDATVVIREGKLAAVGRNVAVPEDAEQIDGTGGTVMPGIIDPHFEVSVAAATADTGPRTVVLRGRVINIPGAPARGGAFTRIADNFYPYDPGYRSLPRLGLTRLNLLTSGMGQAALARATPASPEQMLDRAEGVAFASVSNSTESLDQIRSRLETAAKTRSGGGKPGATGGLPMAPAGPGAQLWVDVLEGKSPLFVTPANSASVVHLLRILESYKNVQVVLYLSGESIAETVGLLKGRRVHVVLRPSIELLPNTRDRFNPGRLLHENGVEFSLSLNARPASTGAAALAGITDTEPAPAIDGDFPLFPVAFLVKTGLPRSVALQALTRQPAAILGLGTSHGTLEPGKAADLLLFSGDPLSPASRLRRTFIDGRTVHAN